MGRARERPKNPVSPSSDPEYSPRNVSMVVANISAHQRSLSQQASTSKLEEEAVEVVAESAETLSPKSDNLLHLPLYLWGDKSLNKIGNTLGNPIVTDECTTNRLRVSYARILVEMNITKELPKVITIRDQDGEKMLRPIEYEWMPLFCGKCQNIGHNCDKSKPKTMQWKPKSSPIEEIKVPIMVQDKNKVIEKELAMEHASDVDQNWIAINKSGKDRGKKHIQGISQDLKLVCGNGFDALGILNDLLEFQNNDQ
ncbi:unnamed protein product [Vicia faba]|uniref:DUF4283 domain-containing protein n=1 Tax=Vicia faba TaxID=3906 RepID=A0AAV0YF29_VICFA|nr:unnamed protein product [Vicia faba]